MPLSPGSIAGIILGVLIGVYILSGLVARLLCHCFRPYRGNVQCCDACECFGDCCAHQYFLPTWYSLLAAYWAPVGALLSVLVILPIVPAFLPAVPILLYICMAYLGRPFLLGFQLSDKIDVQTGRKRNHVDDVSGSSLFRSAPFFYKLLCYLVTPVLLVLGVGGVVLQYAGNFLYALKNTICFCNTSVDRLREVAERMLETERGKCAAKAGDACTAGPPRAQAVAREKDSLTLTPREVSEELSGAENLHGSQVHVSVAVVAGEYAVSVTVDGEANWNEKPGQDQPKRWNPTVMHRFHDFIRLHDAS